MWRIVLDDQEIRRAGLKITQPRRKVLHVLQSAKHRHMSAEDIYKRLLEDRQNIALATVYRVLAQFEAANIVIRHHFEGDIAVFELNEGRHHDHLVCIRCAHIEEFFDEIIERRQRELVKQAAYLMTGHHLTIYGICRLCQDNRSAHSGADLLSDKRS